MKKQEWIEKGEDKTKKLTRKDINSIEYAFRDGEGEDHLCN
jgi:hypothetical protein